MTSSPLPLIATIFVMITVAITTWQIHRSESFVFRILEPTIEPSRIFMHLPKRRENTKISLNANSLPSWDFTRLINMPGFTFLLENTICNESSHLDILVMVHTAPTNTENRNAIRETWGQPRQGMRTLFLLGSVDDQTIQGALDAEDRKYHDLIQGNFHDAYRNMTYKHILIFKYVVYYCPSVKYILKTDDDVFVNIPLVMDYMKNLPEDKTKNLILGRIRKRETAQRGISKWSVSFSEYPHSLYPTNALGFAIIYSYDVAFRLYREAQRGEFMWIDDVFVSGTLAKRINIKHTSIPPGSIMSYKEMDKFIASKGMEGPDNFWYGPLNLGYEKVREMWQALMHRIASKTATNVTTVNNTTR